MSFEQKTWYNDGIVPDDAPEGTVAPCIDADNLNRIEKGIAEADSNINKIGETVDKIEAHYIKACDVTKQLIKLAVGGTLSWTATEDCWLSVYARGNIHDDGGTASILRVDGVVIFEARMDSYSSAITNSFILPPVFFARKGSVISLDGNSSAYCVAYGCL